MNKISIEIIVNKFVTVVPEHVDLVPSEDGQLTETDSPWTVLTITL
jgi:hypothetical protein